MRFRINADELALLSPPDRLAMLSLFKEAQAQMEWNPLELYDPHKGQRECHEAIDAYVRAFFGGNRAGKTTMGVVDSLIQACPSDLVPEELRAYKKFECPFYCRVISPSRDLLNTVMIPKFREWTPKAMLRDENFDRAYAKQDKMLRLECGCRFDFMSQEQELDKFGGAALHRILYDEEPPEDIRDESAARLLDFDGDEIFAMTPLKGLTWMYKEILEAGETRDDIHVTISSMLDNPYLPLSVRKRVMALWGADSEVAQARIYGNFIHFGGMVYPKWRDVLVTGWSKEFIATLKRVYCGIDPGVRNTGLSWIGFDHHNNAYRFDGTKLKDVDVSQVATVLRDREHHWGLTNVDYIIDPAARQRTLTHAVTVETEYYANGINCRPGQNDVEGGVMQIRRRMAHGKLAVADHLESWQKEARGYRIEERVDGKFAVVKEKDHEMDADRYVMMEEPYDPAELPTEIRALPDNVAKPPSNWRQNQRQERVAGRYA